MVNKVVNFDTKYVKKEKSPAKNFYHYTSPEALLSIVKNKNLRFTDCLFLNDSEEYNYIRQVLAKVKESIKDSSYNIFFDNIFSLLDTENESYLLLRNKENKIVYKSARYYVLSGTNNADSLPMWCYYSKGSGYYGYAIQFNTEGIIKNITNNSIEIYYGRVLYDEQEQTDVVKALLLDLNNDYLEEIKSISENEVDELTGKSIHDRLGEELQYKFIEIIQDIRLFFKNPGFKHENEYRFVIKSKENDDVLNINYAVINGIFKPYIELDLKDGFERGAIKKIVLSPSINESDGKKSIKLVLKTNGLLFDKGKKIEIEHSKLKLRY